MKANSHPVIPITNNEITQTAILILENPEVPFNPFKFGKSWIKGKKETRIIKEGIT